jgi:hypothetical protein
VLPPAMVRNEVESGQLRALRTKPDVGFGTLVIAFVGPIHRYRPLVLTISEALIESELTAEL